MDPKEREFAKHFASARCGVLHAQWAMDAFWGEVTYDVILPASLAIHAALVKKGITEKKKIIFNDADDSIFFMKTKSKERKAWVHTTQSRDYLYVMSDETSWDPKTHKTHPTHNLHIRRIYRDLKKDDYMREELEKNPSINMMLQYADSLNEYHDDHYRYSHRPSLKAYKKVDFQIPYHPKDREKERDFYGDFRDGGYVLSFSGSLVRAVGPRVEGSVYSFPELNTISTIFLSCIADELEITVPKLDGHR